jgi:hypothetical protein
MQVALMNVVRKAYRREYPLRAEGRFFAASQLRQQNHELIATVTADGVRVTHARDDATCDGLQQLIANRMPERIVDGLEPIDVHEQYGGRRAMTLCQGGRAAEPIVQQQPVGQSGQRIVLGQVRHPQPSPVTGVFRATVRDGYAIAEGGLLGSGRKLERAARAALQCGVLGYHIE